MFSFLYNCHKMCFIVHTIEVLFGIIPVVTLFVVCAGPVVHTISSKEDVCLPRFVHWLDCLSICLSVCLSVRLSVCQQDYQKMLEMNYFHELFGRPYGKKQSTGFRGWPRSGCGPMDLFLVSFNTAKKPCFLATGISRYYGRCTEVRKIHYGKYQYGITADISMHG